MTKSNYSIAVDAAGLCWACAPDSEGDTAVKQEADEMMGKALRAANYVVHANITLTDEEVGEVLCTATDENALVDDEGVSYKFAVRLNPASEAVEAVEAAETSETSESAESAKSAEAA